MYNELKPCPFCGGEAELYQSYCGYYQIECHQCSARSCTAVEKESVISNWNMRSTTERKSKTMTLDEAIEHCKEVATKNCSECAEEHKQLANWLRTLKYLEENAVMPIHKKQDWLDIAEHYGIKQIPVAIEEMAELTQEGDMVASTGDYIIRGLRGEYYPCKPDVFQKKYEPCE